MVYRLKNIDELKIEDLKKSINRGYRFITYPYSISLIVGNLNLFSPVYFLNKEETKKHTLKYNLISSILGWWSIPNGPTNTINSIKTNIRGGVDVTDDIMLNLTEDSLKSKKVKIEYIYTIFKKPEKSTEKDFIKSIKKTRGIITNQNIYLGRYINTEGFYYLLGFDNISESSKQELLTHLRKIFHNHVHIEIIKINPNDDVHQRLTEMGALLKY